MGLLSLLSVVILSVYIIFPKKVRYFYFKRCRKLCQGLFFHFAKIIIFFWESILFLLFFSLFSLPWLSHSVPRLSHSLPRLSHSVPRLSHSLPWFCCHIPLSNVCPTHPTCRGRSFKKLPGVLKLLPLRGALLIALYPGRCPGLWASAPSGRAACVFCKKKRSHFGLFCHKGFTVLRHLWRFREYLWREGSRPESPLFIGLSAQMWRVNPRFLLCTHTRKKINKERKQQYG